MYLEINLKILISRELEKIEMQGDDLYLPTAPNKIVKGIQVDSGIPLQSAAKVPIMITFNVADQDGDQNDIKPQACIFKVRYGGYRCIFLHRHLDFYIFSSWTKYLYCHTFYPLVLPSRSLCLATSIY